MATLQRACSTRAVDRSRRSGVAIGLVLSVLAVPGAASGVEDVEAELEEAERRERGLEVDLDAAGAAYDQTWAELEAVRAEQGRLVGRAAQLEVEFEQAQDAMTTRAIAMFKRGRTDTSLFFLAARGPGEAADRVAVLSALQSRDRARAERAGALATALAQTEALVADRATRLDVLQTQLDDQRDQLTSRLEQARAQTEDLEQRAANRRRIDRGEQQGIYSCIFAPGRFQFRDTWGAPRSGGRSHRGTDVFAAMGEPVFAFTDGVIARHSSGGLGGIGLYLQGDDGNLYYYSHLQSIDDAGSVGQRVQGGETVAYNGDTGNARGGAPHVHFELRRGGGAQVNPYPWLAAACL